MLKGFNHTLFWTIPLLLLFSCASSIDKKIDRKNLESEVRSIISSEDLESHQELQLRHLTAIAEGRAALIDTIVGRSDSSLRAHPEQYEKMVDNKMVVGKEKFQRTTSELFDHFRANEVTYKEFLAECDSAYAIRENAPKGSEDLPEEVKDRFEVFAKFMETLNGLKKEPSGLPE